MASISSKIAGLEGLGKVFKYAQPYTKVLYRTIFLTVLIAAIAPIRPWLVQYIVDKAIVVFDEQKLFWLSVAMLILLVLQSLMQYFNTYDTGRLGQYVIKDIRKDVFSHILKLRLRFFDNTPVGQLVTRSVSDMETIADIFSEGLIVIIGDILQLLAILLVMFYTDWRLSLIVLIPMPLLIWSTYIFKEVVKDSFQDVRVQVAKLNTFVQEHVTGISIVQFFAREKQEMDKFVEINAQHRDAHIRSNWYYSIFFPVVEIIMAISIGLLVWYGSNQILQNQISAGVVVSFIMYINMLFRPIRELADKFNTLQMGLVGADRVFKLLDIDEKIEDKGSIVVPKIKGEIEFKNVGFSYKEGTPVLRNVSFKVNAGETIALVGATGAGKSSVINILSRFYEYQEGNVSIDGVNIRDYDLQFLNSQIGIVLQEVFLFSGTVLDNIRLKDDSITEQQVYNAAKEIGADDFISHLPNQYQQQVMERGATLSAGQAQLISFARALVFQPSILVLDEATASIDTETEQIIQKGIDKLMQGRTCVIVAHRLSTIQKADKIVVLDKGEIKEIGTHQELLEIGGYYKKLYDLQFSAEIKFKSTTI